MGKYAKKLATGTLIAAAAGYIAGILTAPKSGKETREDIKETAQKGLSESEKELKKLHTELNALLDDGKKMADDLGGKAGKDLTALLEKAKESKEKARELLSAIHEGEVEDKDLTKAVAEANKAIEHLRTYLKK